jgi:hypothetical protein
MKINIFKVNIISVARKTNSIHFNCRVGDALFVRSDYVKDSGITLDSKLHFQRHVDLIICCIKAATANLFHRV